MCACWAGARETLLQRQVFKVLHHPEASICTQKSGHGNTDDPCHVGTRAWKYLNVLPATPTMLSPPNIFKSRAPLAWSWGDRPQPSNRANRTRVPQTGSWLPEAAVNRSSTAQASEGPFTCRDPWGPRKPARPEPLVRAAPSTSGVRKQPSPELSGGLRGPPTHGGPELVASLLSQLSPERVQSILHPNRPELES